MSVTPSKDHKRIERELKKAAKREARALEKAAKKPAAAAAVAVETLPETES